MDMGKVVDFAPFIIVVMIFFYQNKVFVRPSDLEKKHREILKDVKQDYVELNAYKEFQHHVMQEFENINKKIDDKFAELKEILLKRRKDD